MVQLTVTSHKDQDFEPFTVRPYVRESLCVVSDVKSMQETYPHLAVRDPVGYSYGKRWDGTWIGCLPCHPSVRELRGWQKLLSVRCTLAHRLGLSGPLPSSSSLVSTCFKANVEQDYKLACQVRSWCGMESYGTYKQAVPRSGADACAQEVNETTNFFNGQR